MTSSNKAKILAVESLGISCKSDLCLYDPSDYTICVLSIYGAPQQTKGFFSALATGKPLCAGDIIVERAQSAIRFKGTKIGYAKHHGLITTEEVGSTIIIWTDDNDRLNQVHRALSRRRIPFDPSRLPEIEGLLLSCKYLTPLTGWGAIGGYRTEFNDNEICDLILTEIYHKQLASRHAA